MCSSVCFYGGMLFVYVSLIRMVCHIKSFCSCFYSSSSISLSHQHPKLDAGVTINSEQCPLGTLVYLWSFCPGLQVLATASHYWPLDAVDGIHELLDQIGSSPRYVSGSEISTSIHGRRVYIQVLPGKTFLFTPATVILPVQSNSVSCRKYSRPLNFVTFCQLYNQKLHSLSFDVIDRQKVAYDYVFSYFIEIKLWKFVFSP